MKARLFALAALLACGCVKKVDAPVMHSHPVEESPSEVSEPSTGMTVEQIASAKAHCLANDLTPEAFENTQTHEIVMVRCNI